MLHPIQEQNNVIVTALTSFLHQPVSKASYFMQFMTLSQSGGFYSAEDADSYPTYGASHKKEGAFCVWTYDEVQSLLSKRLNSNTNDTLATVFCAHYDVKPQGNVNPLQVGKRVVD
jgi:uncharacterized protein YyaL (SSP411 family)